jgi:hypothetical protein
MGVIVIGDSSHIKQCLEGKEMSYSLQCVGKGGCIGF